MISLYVYAVVARPPRGPTAAGLRDEPLRFVRGGGCAAAVGEMATAPRVSLRALRRHDATVRRLAERAAALLPTRFGSLMAREADLIDLLETHARELHEGLRLVRGREQMTLRVYGGRPAVSAASLAGDAALGPGTRFLRRRIRDRDDIVRAIAPLRLLLAPLIGAERTEPHGAPPFLGSVYHLVRRGRAGAYCSAVRAGAEGLAVRVTASGPWAPYAFVPEVLS